MIKPKIKTKINHLVANPRSIKGKKVVITKQTSEHLSLDYRLTKQKAPTDKAIHLAYNNFIVSQNHPCMMAQTVFVQDRVSLHIYNKFPSHETAKTLFVDLEKYVKSYNFKSNEFYTFLAVFKETKWFSEKEFEAALWKQLQLLHNIDPKKWDNRVSSHPGDKDFSFSIAGEAFYMVGMHPQSSRKARQAPYPTIAFNLHWQFEKLREMGVYNTVRDKIRERDKALQGNINPVLEDFGERSEARQYSGRKIEPKWECPFHPKNH